MTVLSEEKRKLLALRLHKKGIGTGHLEDGRIPRRDRGPSGPARLSFAQRRLWVLDQLEPGNPFYNIPAVADLHGPLDAGVLVRCFAEIVRRHESLRTTFAARGGVPWQIIAPPTAAWTLPRIDLTALPAPAARAECERLTAAEMRTPCDLARGPLLRTALLRLGADEHRLLVILHHIVSDGWSNGLFLREMAALYEAFAAGRPSPLPELPIQYADFAELAASMRCRASVSRSSSPGGGSALPARPRPWSCPPTGRVPPSRPSAAPACRCGFPSRWRKPCAASLARRERRSSWRSWRLPTRSCGAGRGRTTSWSVPPWRTGAGRRSRS